MEQSATASERRIAQKNRITIITAIVILAGSTVGLALYTHHVVQLNEQRVLAGDYPFVHLEEVPVKVEESGEVKSQGARFEHPRYVGSLNFTPAGEYGAILVAHDGDPKHREKGEVVLAARDGQGAWHPASGAQLLERVKKAAPGTLR